MAFQGGHSRVSPWLLLQVAGVIVVLSLMLPGARARLFAAKSEYTDQVAVLVDVQFTVHLTARKDDQEVGSRQLTEKDVEKVRLNEVASRNLNSLELVFEGSRGEAGFLTYRFLRYDSPDIVGLSKNFDLAPGAMFHRVDSKLEHVTFGEPSHAQVNLGDAKASYLCDREETVSFKKTSAETDGYDYAVELSTCHFHAQAFNVKNGEFSSDPPTVCKEPSSSNKVAIVASSAAGGVFFLAVVAVVVVLVVRHRRQQAYEGIGDRGHV